MATSKSKATAGAKVQPKKRDPNVLAVPTKPDENSALVLAQTLMSPSVAGSITMQAYKKHFGEIDLMGLIGATREQVKSVHDGDMKRTEAMLIVQAHTLDTIFNELARRAIGADIMPKLDTYLRLALKAQNQCRTTLETLAEIKNPKPTAFIKQQNVGVNQQVNNGELANSPNDPHAQARAHGKIKNQPNELLTEGAHHGTTLDSGRTGKAIGANQELETVGAVNRR